MKPFLISALFLLAMGSGMVSSTEPFAGETVNPLLIQKIRHSPDDFDGKSIKVSGQVRSISSERGKRGSEYLVIVIEGAQSAPEETAETLKVFIYFSPKIKTGSAIIVSGIYHKWGHWGGSEQEHFIEASKITPVEIN
jgi:hypothetical protein